MYNEGMTPIQAFSHLCAKKIEPSQAWALAKEHLHEHLGWSSVLAHALKEDPTLFPSLHSILIGVPGPTQNAASSCVALTQWMQAQTLDDVRVALAIWAAQREIQEYPLHRLVNEGPLAWYWSLALALVPDNNEPRLDRQLLGMTLRLEHNARTQTHSDDHKLDASMLSNMFDS